MDDINVQMANAMKQFKKLQSMKKEVENNKLCNRNDVQVLRKKIASLNQDLIYSKQDVDRTKKAYEDAEKIYTEQKNQHRQYVEHLTLISDSHKQEQHKKLEKLMSAMKMPQQHTTTLLSEQDKIHHHNSSS